MYLLFRRISIFFHRCRLTSGRIATLAPSDAIIAVTAACSVAVAYVASEAQIWVASIKSSFTFSSSAKKIWCMYLSMLYLLLCTINNCDDQKEGVSRDKQQRRLYFPRVVCCLSANQAQLCSGSLIIQYRTWRYGIQPWWCACYCVTFSMAGSCLTIIMTTKVK